MLLQQSGNGSAPLMLFRRRADVLRISGQLCDRGTRHRLRIGGLPRAGLPWISVLVNQLRTRDVWPRATRDAAGRAWSESCAGRYVAREWTFDGAWELLREIGRDGSAVDLRVVVDRLATAQVPDEALIRELGPGGPVVGTVHASKGREADAVVVCVQERRADNSLVEQAAEEARVLYVAATRARDRLDIRKSPSLTCGYADGRAWHSIPSGIQVEVGRDGDLDPTWAMLIEHGRRAAELQSQLASFTGTPMKVRVLASRADGWTRLVQLDRSDTMIGTLSRGSADELNELARSRVHKWANFIAHLWWIDVVSATARPDDERVDRLPSPWKHTRTWLAPIVVGLGFIGRR